MLALTGCTVTTQLPTPQQVNEQSAIGVPLYAELSRSSCRFVLYKAPSFIHGPYYGFGATTVNVTSIYTDTDSYYKNRWYVVELRNADVAYVPIDKLIPADINSPSSLQSDCLLSINPKDVQSRIEEISPLERMERERKDALREKFEKTMKLNESKFSEIMQRSKLPYVSIGMTAEKVIKDTSWGAPEKINRTTSKRGVREQWVYSGGRYLYFENDHLTVIQD